MPRKIAGATAQNGDFIELSYDANQNEHRKKGQFFPRKVQLRRVSRGLKLYLTLHQLATGSIFAGRLLQENK
ncbi:MAG: hypothetical protein PHV34_05170 [Verrucomicrobiae bacterium]|nr:hypothetical protein [Verrucomicrobiae bacterium]